jgi:hypothetical protein
MSLGRQKNLIVLGAVAAALLVAGVIVADYADILPGRAKADQPVKACQSGEAKPCCAAKGEAVGFAQVVAATTEVVPAEGGCGGEKPSGCCQEGGPGQSCGKPSPADCPKPCCEKKPGCCEDGQPGKTATGCCAGKAEAATE